MEPTVFFCDGVGCCTTTAENTESFLIFIFIKVQSGTQINKKQFIQ